jgi:hypothetical protein
MIGLTASAATIRAPVVRIMLTMIHVLDYLSTPPSTRLRRGNLSLVPLAPWALGLGPAVLFKARHSRCSGLR